MKRIAFLLTVLVGFCSAGLCECFLVCARQDVPGVYMQIVSYGDNHKTWGKKECAPTFYKIFCWDMSKEEYEGKIESGKKYEFNPDLISAENMATLTSTGELYLSAEGFDQCFEEME